MAGRPSEKVGLKSVPNQKNSGQVEFADFHKSLDALFGAWHVYSGKPLETRYPKGVHLLNGICRMCMQGDCLTKVRLEDGIVVRIEGHPDSPIGAGQLCPRGNAAVLNIYNPYRMKRNLKRTNPERGLDVNPRWIEISYEEAVAETAEKINQFRREDPRSIAVCEGFGIRDTYVRTAFLQAIGSPNMVGGAHGVLCSVHFATNLVQASHPVSVPDLEFCNYHISIGRSNGANFATTPGTRRFAKAIARGMRFIAVDPRCSPEASKGEWVPIRPGTDLAFVLAMAYVMMYEIGTYDEWFLKYRTNAPYLIDEEGWYMRDEHTGKPMVYQKDKEMALPYDQAASGQLALFGAYTVNGKACHPAFQLIKEAFREYTPEWAEDKCDVPAATIRRIAREFVYYAGIGNVVELDGVKLPLRPVSLNCERGTTDHQGGTYTDLVTKIINMLVGAIEVPGSCLGAGQRGPELYPDEDGTVAPRYESVGVPFKFPPDYLEMAEFYPHRHTAPHVAARAIIDPEKYYLDYRCRVWFTIGGNPVRRTADPHIYVEAFKKIDFMPAISYHLDEPAWMSDIVFAEDSFLERDSLRNFQPQHQTASFENNGLRMVMARQTVPRIFSTKHCDDILMDIGEKMGILFGPGGLNDKINSYRDKIMREQGLYFHEPYLLDLHTKYTIAELYDMLARAYFGDHRRDYKYVQEQGFIPYRLPYSQCYNYYYFPDDKTRHPFYFQRMKFTGQRLFEGCKKYDVCVPGWPDMETVMQYYHPIPRWIEGSEFGDIPEYPLYAINWKTPFFSNAIGAPHKNHILNAANDIIDAYEEVVWVHPDTARKYGVRNGQRIRLESRYGAMEAVVRETQLVHPQTIGVPGGEGRGKMAEMSNFNSLLTTREDTYDALNVCIDVSPRVRIIGLQG